MMTPLPIRLAALAAALALTACGALKPPPAPAVPVTPAAPGTGPQIAFLDRGVAFDPVKLVKEVTANPRRTCIFYSSGGDASALAPVPLGEVPPVEPSPVPENIRGGARIRLEQEAAATAATRRQAQQEAIVKKFLQLKVPRASMLLDNFRCLSVMLAEGGPGATLTAVTDLRECNTTLHFSLETLDPTAPGTQTALRAYVAKTGGKASLPAGTTIYMPLTITAPNCKPLGAPAVGALQRIWNQECFEQPVTFKVAPPPSNPDLSR